MLCLNSIRIWFNYFLIYSIITITLIPIFNYINIASIKNINRTKIKLFSKIIILFSILSLGGLPPFLGFTAKLRAILTSFNLVPISLILILIFSSLISLFYYLKLTYNILIRNSMEININFEQSNFSINLMTSFTILGNLLIPLLVLLS